MIIKIINRLLPSHCALCNSVSKITTCEPCIHDLPWVKHRCQSCGQGTHAPIVRCKACQSQPGQVYPRFAPLFYEGTIKKLMWQFKFGDALHLARTFAELLEYAYPMHEAQPELFLPVPLHPKRMRERGFNQSIQIAKILKQNMGIPYDWRAIERLKYTEPQHLLSQQKRKVNLKEVFHITRPIHASHVAIIDDVITTGETSKVLADLLRQSGVPQVSIWAVAQTPLVT